MQFEEIEAQQIMWIKLNVIMMKHIFSKPNLKGFLVDITHVNWSSIKVVHGSSDATVVMVDKEQTCLFHWTQSLDKHTKQLIKHELKSGHKAMCFEYKNATSLIEANTCYVPIHYWWFSSNIASKSGIHELES
jgi:hypothetical protein